MLEKLGHSGVENLIVVPVSFVSEHIETLQEIDRKYKDLAIKCGINNWRRVPALNTNDRFISDMADMVVRLSARAWFLLFIFTILYMVFSFLLYSLLLLFLLLLLSLLSLFLQPFRVYCAI